MEQAARKWLKLKGGAFKSSLEKGTFLEFWGTSRKKGVHFEKGTIFISCHNSKRKGSNYPAWDQVTPSPRVHTHHTLCHVLYWIQLGTAVSAYSARRPILRTYCTLLSLLCHILNVELWMLKIVTIYYIIILIIWTKTLCLNLVQQMCSCLLKIIIRTCVKVTI
jgi:hypothetical protein